MARHKMIDLPRHGTKDAARTEAERLATETQTLTVYFRYGYTWYVTSANDPMFQKYAGIKCITVVEPDGYLTCDDCHDRLTYQFNRSTV